MRFFICSYPYANDSAGIRLLYILQEQLIRRGQTCIVIPMVGNRLFADPALLTPTDIMVYHEGIVGNPANAKRVVRYILSPFFRFNERYYGNDDYITTFCRDMEHVTGGKRLSFPLIEPFFRNEGRERVGDCFYVGKADSFRDEHGRPSGRQESPELAATIAKLTQTGVLQIKRGFPPTREQLADLLNRTKTLFTFDDYSAINEEARLCGCAVRYLAHNGTELPFAPKITPMDRWQEQLTEFLADVESKWGDR